MATTTTTIRTTTGGSRGKRRSSFRRRAATRKPRPHATSTALTTTRTRERTTILGDRGGALRYVLPAAVVAALVYFLWPKDAKAGENDGGGGRGGGGGGGGTPGANRNHPPPGTVATVSVLGQPSILVRSRPTTSASKVPPPAPGQPNRDPRQDGLQGLVNGATATVVRSDIPQEGIADTPGRNRWWEVTTTSDGRRGFIRAQGPQGEWNLEWTAPAKALMGMRMAPGAFAGPAPPPMLQALLMPQAAYQPLQPQPMTSGAPWSNFRGRGR